MTNIEKISSLLNAAKALSSFHSKWRENYSDRKHYDKQGYGFNDDDRFGTKAMPIWFSSHIGVYGSSSCHQENPPWDDDVRNAFVKALNKNQELIFSDMAGFLNKEALALREQAQREVDKQTELLASLEPVAP